MISSLNSLLSYSLLWFCFISNESYYTNTRTTDAWCLININSLDNYSQYITDFYVYFFQILYCFCTFLFIFIYFRYPMVVWCHLKSIIYWWAVDALQETKPRMQLCEIWWRALLAVKELAWLQRSACLQAKALTVNDKLHSFTILAASLTFY